jgi:hypothetical protein|tara:strand:+ start:318 stop:644 length:327 start_codon:yes stop_codon:yes gene_type:complete
MDRLKTYISFIMITIVIAGIGASLLNNNSDTQEWSSFSTEVVSEKVLYTNAGACYQEFYIQHEDSRHRVYNELKPWLNVGDRILVNRYEREANYRSGSTVINYHYANK